MNLRQFLRRAVRRLIRPLSLLHLEDFHPQPQLVTPVTRIEKPRYPAIDAHNHLDLFGHHPRNQSPSSLIDILDACGIAGMVDLDGGWGEEILDAHLKKYKEPYPDRFQIFGGVNWNKWPELGNAFPAYAVERLRAQAARGAQGLKVWKVLGLKVRDEKKQLVAVDDPRLDSLWETAAELHLPVLIHVADPVAFFDPIDLHNERWEELGVHPDWAFPSPPGPPFLTIVEGLANLITRHPATTFIGAHVGCYAENLAWVAALLDRCPNFYIDISARTAELGRQPYTSRKFFLKYADRILYGSDTGLNPDEYRLAWRFLESEDEYFPYGSGQPSQGRWRVHGMGLPDDVLQRIYQGNAQRILNFPARS